MSCLASRGRSPRPWLLTLLWAACSASPEPAAPADLTEQPVSAPLHAPTKDAAVVLTCADGGTSAPQVDAAPPDAAVAANPDPNGCIGRSKCDCYARGCALLTTSCWCPAECGAGVCVCGGGAFLGCAPPESKCRNGPVCNAAGVAVGQDERGCFRCAYESDCDKALAQLVRTCRYAAEKLSAFRCGCNPSCVTRCINSVVSCQEIGCGFSTLASCKYPTGSFEACVAACQ